MKLKDKFWGWVILKFLKIIPEEYSIIHNWSIENKSKKAYYEIVIQSPFTVVISNCDFNFGRYGGAYIYNYGDEL